MKIRAIVTGSTGMVGEGVLHECLQHPQIEQVLIINRRPLGLTHPKLKEIIHKDFYDLSPIAEQLRGYNACFFCLGVSSVGMKEPEYHHVTYDLTMQVAKVLAKENPDMVFGYVSGAGTDSTEKGRTMWARVKGKTENDLMKLPFKKVYAYRPGFMQPTKGLKNALSFYKYVDWMFPLLKKFFPNHASTLSEIGKGMIQSAISLPSRQVLEVADLVELSKR